MPVLLQHGTYHLGSAGDCSMNQAGLKKSPRPGCSSDTFLTAFAPTGSDSGFGEQKAPA
jgi:hypothetical protein